MLFDSRGILFLHKVIKLDSITLGVRLSASTIRIDRRSFVLTSSDNRLDYFSIEEEWDIILLSRAGMGILRRLIVGLLLSSHVIISIRTKLNLSTT